MRNKILLLFMFWLIFFAFPVKSSYEDDFYVLWQNWTKPTTYDFSYRGTNATIDAYWTTDTHILNSSWNSLFGSGLGLTSSIWYSDKKVYIPMENGFTFSMLYDPDSEDGSYADVYSYGPHIGSYNPGFPDDATYLLRKDYNNENSLQAYLRLNDSVCTGKFSGFDFFSAGTKLLITSYSTDTGNLICTMNNQSCGVIACSGGTVNVTSNYIGMGGIAQGGGVVQGHYYQFVVWPRSLNVSEKSGLYNSGNYLQLSETTDPGDNKFPVIVSIDITLNKYVNKIINVTGDVADEEGDTIYSAIDCTNSSNPSVFTVGEKQNCTYSEPGNYTIRYYATDDVHPNNYSVYEDSSIEVLSNTLPSIDYINYSDLTPFENEIIYINASATDTELDDIYYSIDCTYPSTPTNFTTNSYKNCTYSSPGNYTTRYYITDSNHPDNRSVYQDQDIEVFPNQLPIITSVSASSVEPLKERKANIEIFATDNESDTLYYAIDCDYNEGDTGFVYDTNNIKRCLYNSTGNYTIRAFVTDEYRLNNYSVYYDILASVKTVSTDYFFEDFGSGFGVHSMSSAGTWNNIRSSSYLESLPIYSPTTGNGFEHEWHYFATDGSRWLAHSSNDYLYNTYGGIEYTGYGTGGDYATVAYVFDSPFSFEEGDYLDFFCGNAHRNSDDSGYFWMVFSNESGEGGFCLSASSSVSTCGFDNSDVGCEGSNICVDITDLCDFSNWDKQLSESNPIEHVRYDVYNSIPESNRKNLKNLELIIEHSGGPFSDPETHVVHLDDLTIDYTPEQQEEIEFTYIGGYTVSDGDKDENVDEQVCTCNPGYDFNIITRIDTVVNYEEVGVPNYVREETTPFTCGIDANQDGFLCDPNEDWISCPEDCEFPSINDLLCLQEGNCVWNEAWILHMVFMFQLIVSIYITWLEVK